MRLQTTRGQGQAEGLSSPAVVNAPAGEATPAIDVAVLLGSRREAVLTLNGESYRLRITSRNKLILTK